MQNTFLMKMIQYWNMGGKISWIIPFTPCILILIWQMQRVSKSCQSWKGMHLQTAKTWIRLLCNSSLIRIYGVFQWSNLFWKYCARNTWRELFEKFSIGRVKIHMGLSHLMFFCEYQRIYFSFHFSLILFKTLILRMSVDYWLIC